MSALHAMLHFLKAEFVLAYRAFTMIRCCLSTCTHPQYLEPNILPARPNSSSDSTIWVTIIALSHKPRTAIRVYLRPIASANLMPTPLPPFRYHYNTPLLYCTWLTISLALLKLSTICWHSLRRLTVYSLSFSKSSNSSVLYMFSKSSRCISSLVHCTRFNIIALGTMSIMVRRTMLK